MIDSKIELLLRHHPLWFTFRRPTEFDKFDRLERPKLPPLELTDHNEQTRSTLERIGLAFAALLLLGLVALTAAGGFTPPPVTAVADLPPNER